jgi:hypothetical protein
VVEHPVIEPKAKAAAQARAMSLVFIAFFLVEKTAARTTDTHRESD